MWNLLKRIFIGTPVCEHKWIIHKEGIITSQWDKDTKVGTFYTLKCKKCGDLKNNNYYA